MFIRFEKKYLEELYYTKTCSDKKHRFQPQVIDNYIRRIITLQDVPNIEALFPMNSLNYERLSGDKKGISSVRVNDQYRIEFTVSTKESETTVTICNILELSNHYK